MIIDKNIVGVYNIDINKNRGMKMKNNKYKETIFVWWMVLAICWLFLRIGTDIHKTRRINEASEHEISRKRERILERNLEKSRLFNLYLKVIVSPSWM